MFKCLLYLKKKIIYLIIFKITGDSMWQEDKSDIEAHSSTQFVYNAHHSLALNMQRQRLPAFKYKSHIIYLLEKYQTLVLIGETGCGKSTQLPQVYFYFKKIIFIYFYIYIFKYKNLYI